MTQEVGVAAEPNGATPEPPVPAVGESPDLKEFRELVTKVAAGYGVRLTLRHLIGPVVLEAFFAKRALVNNTRVEGYVFRLLERLVPLVEILWSLLNTPETAKKVADALAALLYPLPPDKVKEQAVTVAGHVVGRVACKVTNDGVNFPHIDPKGDESETGLNLGRGTDATAYPFCPRTGRSHYEKSDGQKKTGGESFPRHLMELPPPYGLDQFVPYEQFLTRKYDSEVANRLLHGLLRTAGYDPARNGAFGFGVEQGRVKLSDELGRDLLDGLAGGSAALKQLIALTGLRDDLEVMLWALFCKKKYELLEVFGSSARRLIGDLDGKESRREKVEVDVREHHTQLASDIANVQHQHWAFVNQVYRRKPVTDLIAAAGVRWDEVAAQPTKGRAGGEDRVGDADLAWLLRQQEREGETFHIGGKSVTVPAKGLFLDAYLKSITKHGKVNPDTSRLVVSWTPTDNGHMLTTAASLTPDLDVQAVRVDGAVSPKKGNKSVQQLHRGDRVRLTWADGVLTAIDVAPATLTPTEVQNPVNEEGEEVVDPSDGGSHSDGPEVRELRLRLAAVAWEAACSESLTKQHGTWERAGAGAHLPPPTEAERVERLGQCGVFLFREIVFGPRATDPPPPDVLAATITTHLNGLINAHPGRYVSAMLDVERVAAWLRARCRPFVGMVLYELFHEYTSRGATSPIRIARDIVRGVTAVEPEAVRNQGEGYLGEQVEVVNKLFRAVIFARLGDE